MDIRTEEQQVTTIRFFNDEIRHYINHPTDLVAALTRATGIVPSPIVLAEAQPAAKTKRRKQVKPVKHQANWATDGYAGHTSRGAKKAEKVKADATGKVQCDCGQWFAQQGLGPHHRKCATWQLKQAAKTAQANAA